MIVTTVFLLPSVFFLLFIQRLFISKIPSFASVAAVFLLVMLVYAKHQLEHKHHEKKIW